MSSLGTAFSSGVSAGGPVGATISRNRLAKQEMEEKKRIQQLKEHQSRKEQFGKVIDNLVKTTYTSNPDDAQAKIDKLKSDPVIQQQIGLFQSLDTAMGDDPTVTKMMFDQIINQPSPVKKAEEKGRAAGTENVAAAQTVAEKIDGDDATVEKLLGIQKPSSNETLQLIDARDSTADPEKKATIQARLNKITSQGGGEPSVQKNIVLPIISKALKEGTESLSENEWDALALASRTKGVDLLIEQNVRAILKGRDNAIPEPVLQAFQEDKGIPKGATLGKARPNGKFEVLKDGKIIGEFEAP